MKKSRGPGQRKSFGVQETTPNGGVIRKGVRGEGADQRNVEKRLKFTPIQAHRAEYETCDQEAIADGGERLWCKGVGGGCEPSDRLIAELSRKILF